jgi:hypothetical protein
MCINRETSIIQWCGKSCYCNKDQYDRWNALWLWNSKNHWCENMAPSLLQSLCRGFSSSQSLPQLQNLTILIVNLIASWMYLHRYRYFQEHVRMLLRSLRVLCKAPGGAGSIWKYLEALVRATGVPGRFAYGFQTKFHFLDIVNKEY